MAEANIEKGYKRGQNLSKKDQARELQVDTIARRDWSKSKAQYKADKANAKTNYKANVAKSKAQYKHNYKTLKENDTMADKLVYNRATRKAAARYMTKNNMTMAEARKKAKKEAWRNTAIVGALAAGQYATYLARRKMSS